MQSLLRALASRRDTASSPRDVPGPMAARHSLWRRFSWILLIGVAVIGAVLALGNVAPGASYLPARGDATATSEPPLSVPAAAPESIPAYTDPLLLQQETPWGELALDMGLKLGVVVLLLLGTLWLIRYVRRRRDQPAAGQAGVGFAEILDTTELSVGQHVYLLDLGDRVLVLGSTAQQVSSLAEITDRAEIESLRRRTGLRKTRSFAGVLSGAIERAMPAARSRRSTDGETSIAQADTRKRSLKQTSARLRALAESYQERNRVRA